MFTDANLAIIFAGLMALAVLVYAILDGYDLGVGILLPMDDESRRDTMIASIGPFWDANETWLVLAVGLLLIAFPQAHSVVLDALYIPVTVMLIGLILRGVAFDFRAKVAQGNKRTWDKVFKYASLLTSMSQGYMLGMYVMGFESSFFAQSFSILSAIGVALAYTFIGAAWLIMKTTGELQIKSVNWAKRAGRLCFVGILAVCIVNPAINPAVYERWTNYPWSLLFLAIPLICFFLLLVNDKCLSLMPTEGDRGSWLPFVICVLVFVCCFSGLAVSFYPYVVPEQLTIWESASDSGSLRFILYGALVVIPCILGYTLFSYRVFWGKVDKLRYY